MEIHFNTIQETGVTDTLCARYAALLCQLRSTPQTVNRTQLEEVYAREASELLLFMYAEGEIAGMAQASFLCVPSNYTVYVNHVVVDEAYRGKGLGGLLMEALHERAQQQWPSLQKFILTSSPAKGTQGFYTRLGYAMRTKEAGDETIVYVRKV